MRSLALWTCLLCLVIYTTFTQTTSYSEEATKDLTRSETAANHTNILAAQLEAAKQGVDFYYTNHALERMEQRNVDKNEVENTVLTGTEVPAKDGKQKFEKTYTTPCFVEGKRFAKKKVEIVTVKEQEDWRIITVIGDCKQ